MKRVCKNADEVDVHSRWRNYVVWRRGEIRRIKRATNRRERKEGKEAIRKEKED